MNLNNQELVTIRAALVHYWDHLAKVNLSDYVPFQLQEISEHKSIADRLSITFADEIRKQNIPALLGSNRIARPITHQVKAGQEQ